MKHLLIPFLLLGGLTLCPMDSPAQAADSGTNGPRASFSGPDISEDYLEKAREYREEGRFELSRQSYSQALATCRRAEALEVITHELAGVELLLRTMR